MTFWHCISDKKYKNIRISSVIRYFSPGNNFNAMKWLVFTWGFALEDLKSSPEWKWEPSEQFLAQVVNFFKGLWMTPPQPLVRNSNPGAPLCSLIESPCMQYTAIYEWLFWASVRLIYVSHLWFQKFIFWWGSYLNGTTSIHLSRLQPSTKVMVVRLSYLMGMTEISLIGTVFHIFYRFIQLGLFLIMKV